MLQVEYVLCPQSLYLIRMSNFPRSLGTKNSSSDEKVDKNMELSNPKGHSEGNKGGWIFPILFPSVAHILPPQDWGQCLCLICMCLWPYSVLKHFICSGILTGIPWGWGLIPFVTNTLVFKGKEIVAAGTESLSLKATSESHPSGFHGNLCLVLFPATRPWVLDLC